MSAKKVIIEKKDLPPLSPNGEYLLRYRIISEDKNRTSHWSPIYTLDAKRVWNEETQEFENLIKNVTSAIEVTPSDIIITWGDENKASLYDIFISYKIGGTWGSYIFSGSSPIHTYGFLQPTTLTAIGYGATDIRVTIQLAGIEKVISDTITISTAEKSLQPVVSGGGALS
jgi:hypothetical protein